MISVVYRKIGGSITTNEFTDANKAFDKFYPMAFDARKSPAIWSDDHIGYFNHNNIEYL